MTAQTIADISGGNAKVPLTATRGLRARSLYLTATGGTARWGDTNVGSARGNELVENVPTRIDQNGADPTDALDLTTFYLYVPSGTTVTVSWTI